MKLEEIQNEIAEYGLEYPVRIAALAQHLHIDIGELVQDLSECDKVLYILYTYKGNEYCICSGEETKAIAEYERKRAIDRAVKDTPPYLLQYLDTESYALESVRNLESLFKSVERIDVKLEGLLPQTMLVI